MPLGVDRGHIAGIETGTRNPSEPLIKSIHFIYCANEAWIKTGQGKMIITPEEFLKSQKARFGEQAFIQFNRAIPADVVEEAKKNRKSD